VLNIQNEFEGAMELIPKNDQNKINGLNAHLESIKKIIKAEQDKILDNITNILTKNVKSRLNAIKQEYSEWEQDELDEESHELHVRLDYLLGIPLDRSKIVFEPYDEYIIKKLFEIKLRIEVVEENIAKTVGDDVNHPADEPVQDDVNHPADEPVQDDVNQPADEPVGDEVNHPADEPMSEDERRIENMRKILKGPDSGVKSIEEIVEEAMQEPPKPKERDVTPEEKREKQKEMEETANMSRRKFLGLTAVATGALALGTVGLIAHQKLKPNMGLDVDIDKIGIAGPDSTSESQSDATETYMGVKLKIVKPKYKPDNLPALQQRLLKQYGNAKFDRHTGNVICGSEVNRLIEEPMVEFEHMVATGVGGKRRVEKNKVILKISTAKALIKAQKELGKDIIVRESFRTNEFQDYIYQRNNCLGEFNKSGCKKADYPTAPPGLSAHENGQAIDIDNRAEAKAALINNGFLDKVYPDPPHFAFQTSFDSDDRANSEKNDTFVKSPGYQRWLLKRLNRGSKYTKKGLDFLKRKFGF